MLETCSSHEQIVSLELVYVQRELEIFDVSLLSKRSFSDKESVLSEQFSASNQRAGCTHAGFTAPPHRYVYLLLAIIKFLLFLSNYFGQEVGNEKVSFGLQTGKPFLVHTERPCSQFRVQNISSWHRSFILRGLVLCE